MPKHLIALALMVIPLLMGANTIQAGQSVNILGQLEYVRSTNLTSVENIRTDKSINWKRVSLDQANFGFDQAHYWFRVPLINIPPMKSSWFLRSSYPLLDQLDVYLYLGETLAQEFHVGDTLPFKQRPIEHPGFVFPLTLSDNNPNYWVYMHVYTSSAVQLPLSLQPENQYWKAVSIESAFTAAFYAVLVSMLIYNGVIYLMTREITYLYYILYLFSFTTLLASIQGWLYQYFWPNSPGLHQSIVVLSIPLTLLFGIIFGTSFMRTKEVMPDLNMAIKTTYCLILMGFIFAMFLPYSFAIKYNTSLALLVVIVATILTTREWFRSHSKEILIFNIAWITLLFGFGVFIGQKFGLLPVNTFTEFAIEIGAVLEVLLLALGLAERINHEKRDHIVTQHKIIEIKTKANEDMEKKVRERTLELERVNSLLKIATITDSLTQVKNRHYFDQMLPDEYSRACREKSWISLIMLDVDYFKMFNDQYGHQAGDAALQAVGQALRDSITRPSDQAVRYGGEEFAVILPNTSPSAAYKIAERIREKISALENIGGECNSTITASLGVASCIPKDKTEFDKLTRQADEYLYMAKKSGRNKVVMPHDVSKRQVI
ncbi:MAG: hypothetical protein COA42_16210 [Alteromonadaceae bacterium]|nr:MAG: hypothetical protein COA42_16210 [Alteromonadaceae bacterium]